MEIGNRVFISGGHVSSWTGVSVTIEDGDNEYLGTFRSLPEQPSFKNKNKTCFSSLAGFPSHQGLAEKPHGWRLWVWRAPGAFCCLTKKALVFNPNPLSSSLLNYMLTAVSRLEPGKPLLISFRWLFYLWFMIFLFLTRFWSSLGGWWLGPRSSVFWDLETFLIQIKHDRRATVPVSEHCKLQGRNEWHSWQVQVYFVSGQVQLSTMTP